MMFHHHVSHEKSTNVRLSFFRFFNTALGFAAPAAAESENLRQDVF